MPFLLLRLYEHIQNRTIRLGFLCAFVITFIGLPALGQYVGTNIFAALDLVELLGDRIEETAVAMEEARYEAYLVQTEQAELMQEDPMVMLAEEVSEAHIEEKLWDLETLFKNVFSPESH